MVKFCDKCGAKLKSENAQFCQECGTEVKTSQNQNAGTTFTGNVCPHCGQNTPIGQPNCVNCGDQWKLKIILKQSLWDI